MDYISCCRQDMVVLREKAKVIGSEEERNRREEELRAIRRELLELCTETAQKSRRAATRTQEEALEDRHADAISRLRPPHLLCSPRSHPLETTYAQCPALP